MDEKVNSRSGEVSLKDLILSLKRWFRYLFSKWKIIVAFACLGVALGAALYFRAKPAYVAESYFVLDEGNKSSGGLKIEMLGLGGNDEGLFQTDNIIWLYSSRLMLERTLLSEVDTTGKKVLLLNWFLKESGVDKQLKKDKWLKNVVFNGTLSHDSLSVLQNAVISRCVDLINKKYLVVNKLKKTDNIINVVFTSKDELLAKTFIDKIVSIVNSYYIQTKINKTSREVAILQNKADSVRQELNSSMFQTASAFDATPNLNPNLQVLRVRPQQKSVDVQVTSAIYTEVMKMLETRKVELAKETPLIQVVDAPVLPLKVIKPKMIQNCIMGGLLFGFITVLILTLILFYKKVMNS